jgi:hypothetical protein
MQINRLFCKPICKPDAAGQAETGERPEALSRTEKGPFAYSLRTPLVHGTLVGTLQVRGGALTACNFWSYF